MADFIPGDGVVEIDINYSLQDKPAQNTLYVKRTAPWDATTLSDLGSSVVDWWVDQFAPILTQNIVLREVSLRDLTTAAGFIATFTPSTTVRGAVTEESVPNNVAFCVKFTTGRAGRSFRGRNYVAGFTRLAVNDDKVPESFANACVGAYNTFPDALIAFDATWGIFSRYINKAPRVTGLFTPITGVGYTDLTVDTQRGRLK